jgi:hypothetical protein
MPWLAQGVGIGLHELRATHHALVDHAKDLRLGFSAVGSVDLRQFDSLLLDLQDDHANLLLASYDLNKTVAPGGRLEPSYYPFPRRSMRISA